MDMVTHDLRLSVLPLRIDKWDSGDAKYQGKAAGCAFLRVHESDVLDPYPLSLDLFLESVECRFVQAT
jgi:hypothetical protein